MSNCMGLAVQEQGKPSAKQHFFNEYRDSSPAKLENLQQTCACLCLLYGVRSTRKLENPQQRKCLLLQLAQKKTTMTSTRKKTWKMANQNSYRAQDKITRKRAALTPMLDTHTRCGLSSDNNSRMCYCSVGNLWYLTSIQ